MFVVYVLLTATYIRKQHTAIQCMMHTHQKLNVSPINYDQVEWRYETVIKTIIKNKHRCYDVTIRWQRSNEGTYFKFCIHFVNKQYFDNCAKISKNRSKAEIFQYLFRVHFLQKLECLKKEIPVNPSQLIRTSFNFFLYAFYICSSKFILKFEFFQNHGYLVFFLL